MQALIGQRLSSDLNLAAQILILVGLWVGFLFARRKQISRHQAMQTTMVAINSLLIVFVMGTSFYNYVIEGGTRTGLIASLMIVHGTIGLIAELVGIYLILRMSTKILPESLRVRRFKPVMQGLLGIWTLLVLLGVGIYYERYLAPKPAAAADPFIRLVYAVDNLQIHSDEMAEAVNQGRLETARRHAEHLVNLVVGKNSVDYGDVDGDGLAEDPGDGTGSIAILENVRRSLGSSGINTSQANALLDQLSGLMIRVARDAKVVAKTQDIASMTQQMEETSALISLMRDGQDALINQLAIAAGKQVSRPTAAVVANQAAPGTITVTMENFTFSPASVTVKPGTQIVFINKDVAKHTVTADDGKFDSGNIDTGQSYTLTLDQPGTYAYYCRFHGDRGGVDMAGTIVVMP